jgi:hypothetical protein
MRGVLAAGVVPGLLREAYAGRKTGALRFERSAEQCLVRFVNGHIVRATASAKRLHLGEIMVARGTLDQNALDRATEVVVREGRPLGQVLKEAGIIDQDVLENALALHVCEVLAEVFSWREASYVFEEQQPETFLEETDYPLRMSTGNMILEAVTLIQDRDAVRYGLGDLDRVLLPSTSARQRFQHMDVTPLDGFVLSRVDGTFSGREVIELTPLPPEAVEKSLFALLCTGIIEPAPEPQKKPAPASVQCLRREIVEACQGASTRNHFEVLGVARSATDAEVKVAYFRLAKRLHPDIHHHPALADLHEQLEAFFSRLNGAYEILSNPQTRAAYEATLGADSGAPVPGPGVAPAAEPPRAEDMFLRAKDSFSEGRNWEAVALLGETIRFADRGLRSRARVLLAQAYLKNPDTVRHAEKELLAASQEDPANVDACFLLGVVYRQAGLNARAMNMFKKALELQPKHRKALAELHALERQERQP